jgi:hypothetical protein
MRHRTDYTTTYATTGWPVEPRPPALLRARERHPARRILAGALRRAPRCQRRAEDLRGAS